MHYTCACKTRDLGQILLGTVSLAPSGPITLQKVSKKYFIGQCEEKLNRCGMLAASSVFILVVEWGELGVCISRITAYCTSTTLSVSKSGRSTNTFAITSCNNPVSLCAIASCVLFPRLQPMMQCSVQCLQNKIQGSELKG